MILYYILYIFNVSRGGICSGIFLKRVLSHAVILMDIVLFLAIVDMCRIPGIEALSIIRYVQLILVPIFYLSF